MNKIFIAAPMSGFQNDEQYIYYRDKVMLLLDVLSDKYEVYSEVKNVLGTQTYDTPEESVKKDFEAINKTDIFLMFHPIRGQSSTLIELGYACALKKKIIIIGIKEHLPYLVHGLAESDFKAQIIESSDINKEIIDKVLDVIDLLGND